MDKLKNNGVYFALFTAVISGFSVFINKFAVGFIKPPLTFTATKNLFVGVIILFILLLSKKWNKIFDVNRNDLWKLLTISIVGGAIPFYLFFTGISTIPAINAALIHKTLFVWVTLLAIPILKEKVTKLQMVGIAALFASNLVVGGFKGFTFSTGEIMVLAATILWSVENIIAKKVLINIDSDVLTFYRMGVGSIFLIIASL
ncbi:MAG: DMT family transporter, partial [Romboutsia sp.]|nr:DMT family transporter [Romboutsia sp.]